MKWAFIELAKGLLKTEQVWKESRKKGLKTSRDNFWRSIRIPVYCGKIFIPKYKNEEAQLVQGLHEPIINEDLFYKVQDVLEDHRIRLGVKVASRELLPLKVSF